MQPEDKGDHHEKTGDERRDRKGREDTINPHSPNRIQRLFLLLERIK